jgi:hypothetical protein
MPSYFDTFGMPDMSVHMMNRLRQRGISLAALSRALTAEPTAGTTPGTVVYRERAGRVYAIVNAETGRIITVWQE